MSAIHKCCALLAAPQSPPADEDCSSALLLDASRTYWGTLAAPFSEKRFDDDGGRPDLPPPRRVLDLGCGPKAPWCIGLSREVGFEDAEFVGLDVCPDEVTDVLREAKRLLFVKHDFLADKLPFEDNVSSTCRRPISCS